MPQSSWSASNYFADVEFSGGGGAGSPLTVTDTAPQGTDIARDSLVTATLSQDAPSPVIRLEADGRNVPGASAYDATTRRVVFTPASALAESTSYTATLRVDGQQVAEWAFTTAAPDLDGVIGNVFGDATPADAAATDTTPVEVGTAFTVAYPARATAIRFFKGPGNTGAHVGHLWDAQTRELLATVSFDAETDAGWQRAALADPVALQPGREYVASYLAPNGSYGVTAAYFAEPVTNGYVAAPAGDNGRFVYTASGAYPTQSFNSSAYFVDAEVSFSEDDPEPAVAVSDRAPAPGATGVAVGAGVNATLTGAQSATMTVTTDGAPVTGVSSFAAPTGVVSFQPAAPFGRGKTYTVSVTANGADVTDGTWTFQTTPASALVGQTPAPSAANLDPRTVAISATVTNASSAALSVSVGGTAVAGTSAFDAASGKVSFTPSATLRWDATFAISLLADGAPLSGGSWSFSTMIKPDKVSLFTTGTPTNPNANSLLANQMGTRFKTSAPGAVTSIRFYKGSQNTRQHIGYLRAANGAILGQVTFRGETASGWQTAALPTPVRLTPGTEYRVTLYSASGRYAVTNAGLASTVTSGPLSTIGGVSGTGTANPTSTNTNKYWVDVIFDPDD
jgi:hypothetical protein